MDKMSALNKLNRAFDAFKKVNIKLTPEANKQNFRLAPCLTITELVCKSNEKTALLPFAITSLVQLLEDADSNTRLVIDESLNKIIRSSLDNPNHIAKILISLLKILGKNTNERSLRAALWRFSKLAHHIRPHKGKVYLKTLIPIFVKLANRKEESVHETLAESLPNIFRNVGLFTSDSHIRSILKTFFHNLKSESVEIRRASASCILTVCELSRKPEYFFSYSIVSMIDFLADCQTVNESNKVFVQGCLSCMRQMIPSFVKFVRDPHSSNSSSETEKLLQIFELCLFFSQFRDQNITTSALETLNQLLKHGHPAFIAKLVQKDGLTKSTLLRQHKNDSVLSLSAHSDVPSLDVSTCTEDAFYFGGSSPTPPASLSGSCVELKTEPNSERTENWISEQSVDDTDAVSLCSELNMDASHFANSDDDISNRDECNFSYPSRTLSIDNISSINEYEMSSIKSSAKGKFRSSRSLPTTSIIPESAQLRESVTMLNVIFDGEGAPLELTAQFLVSTFLLNPSSVRVSVMSLALTCLAQMWRIEPNSALVPSQKFDSNRVLDIVLSYASHDDHQIRGYVNLAIAHFLSSYLMKNQQHVIADADLESKKALLNRLISRLHSGLEDESSICVRHTLSALSVCANLLLQSCEHEVTLSLLEMIFVLSENPYWLIKMKILEIVQELQYEQLFYETDRGRELQERILEKIIIAYLGDADGRVRNAAAHALPKFVKRSYYPLDHQFRPVVIAYAKKRNLDSLPPYLRGNGQEFVVSEQRSLIRVVHRMYSILTRTSCKHLTAGCCEAFAVLAAEYPPSGNNLGWQCDSYYKVAGENSYSPLLLCEVLLSLLTNSILIVNFDVHLSILKTISELFAALCVVNVKSKKVNSAYMDGAWSFLNDYKLGQLAESFFQHLVRLANIFNDIVTNSNVKPLDSAKWQKTPSSPLPIDEPLVIKQRSDVVYLNTEAQTKKRNRSWRENKYSFSQYNHLVAYMKLREALKSAFTNYEVTLKPESSEKFVTFLKTVLEIFEAVLNFTTTSEIDRICKDLLKYLRSFTVFLPVQSVRCVKLLLKSIFGTNLLAEYSYRYAYEDADARVDEQNEVDAEEFYHSLFQNPVDRMFQFLKANEKLRPTRDKEKFELVSPNTLQAKRGINLNMLPSYIKLVEANVILSLKVYTVTSDAHFQAEVLSLLSELIQLKINYCLLDADQIFIQFVLSQFQLIEEEHLLNMDTFLPAIFDFLIHLANEKHSKPVMTIPKVIQLCDSLIAGIQAVPHCVAAMELVVRHVFLKSSVIADTNEVKELETQRDVLLAMLLKLLHNPRTFPLLVLILEQSDEDAKLKRSNQIVDNLLNVLAEQKTIDVDPTYTSTHLLDLLFALQPGSYSIERFWRTALNMCFSYRGRRDVVSWLPLFTPFIIFLLSRCSERQLLDAIEKNSNHIIFSDNAWEDENSSDPLLVSVVQVTQVRPTTAFAKILLGNVKQILRELNLERGSDFHYKLQLLSELELIILHTMTSGRFESIKSEFYPLEAERSDSAEDVSSVDYSIGQLWITCPEVILRWWQVTPDKSTAGKDNMPIICRLPNIVNDYSLNWGMMKLGLFFLVCRRLREWLTDVDTLRNFLEANYYLLLTNTKESVVRDVLLHIQKDEAASGILVEVMERHSAKLILESTNVLKMLECLDYCHEAFSGKRLALYGQLALFDHPCVPIANAVTQSANSIVSYLEALDDEDSFKHHLDNTNIELVLQTFQNPSNADLRSLANRLYRLAERWCGIPAPSMSDEEKENLSDRLRCAVPNKDWFFHQVKDKCCRVSENRCSKMAIMLDRLPEEDALEIMNSSDFNCKILPFCFTLHSGQHSQTLPSDPSEEDSERVGLFSTATKAVCQRLRRILFQLPENHQVYEPVKRAATDEELLYTQKLDAVFSCRKFVDQVLSLIPAVNTYLHEVSNSRASCHSRLFVDDAVLRDLMRFAVLSLELTYWLVKKNRASSKSVAPSALECCILALETNEILNAVGPSHIGSITSSLYALVESCTRDIIKFKTNPIFEKIPELGSNSIRHSAHTVSILTEYFLSKMPIDDPLMCRCKMLLIALSRSPFVYDYVRIPLEMWKLVGPEDVVTKNCLTLNTISEYFLQDCDILQNVVSRLMFHGWNCRTQFEECWMSLLTALNSLPEQDVSEEEQQALSQVCAVTISAVTSLLVQTLYFPIPGRKTRPFVLHVSRNSFWWDKRSRWKSKMAVVNEKLTQKAKIEGETLFSLFDNVTVNVERLHDKNKFHFNQVSVEYLLFHSSNAENREDVVNIFTLRQQSIENLGLDSNSCVYFLMDFYTRWLLKPGEPPVQTLLEIVNSLIVISDLFTEVTQFAWLLESGFDLWRKYSKSDDTVCAYLIVIICKATAVFVPLEVESKKMVVRVLKIGLTHNSIRIQTTSLQGLLYLLERIFKRDILNQVENIDGPFRDEILSVAINYVLENLDVDFTETYEEKTMHCVMSVGYYLIEHNICGENTGLIIDRFIKLSVRACKMKWWRLHTTISQGMFNMILTRNGMIRRFDGELSQMVKEILCTVECNPAAALLTLQILIASMYTTDELSDTSARSSDDAFDSEKLIVKMEKISIFFERIKKCRRVEAKLICAVLPQILNDLFPPSEILNKVILEFLSTRQPHSDLLAEVVYEVFQNAIQQAQLSLIQDWVLSLLNNFSNSPESEAVYYLTCFFISACTNTWLTAFFPAIRASSDGRNGSENKELLCIAAVQFYSELTDESQKQKFLSTFQAVDSNILCGRFKEKISSVSPG